MLNVIFNNLNDAELAKAIANGLPEHVGMVISVVNKADQWQASEEDKHRIRLLGDLCQEWKQRQEVQQIEESESKQP